MLDIVTTKVEFEVPTEERATEIYNSICVGNEFVFDTVEPTPFDFYCDAMGKEKDRVDVWDERRHEWITNIWFSGYKSCPISELEWIGGGTAAFKLYTLWAVPYQVLLGFGNKFKVPFTLKHVEKDGRYCGIETFELDENERVKIAYGRYSLGDDWRDLYIELNGAEPESCE